MKKEQMLQILDDADKYMIQYLGKNYNFENPNDFNVRSIIASLANMQVELQGNPDYPVIKERLEITKQAYEVAKNNGIMPRNPQRAIIYFDYINNERQIEQRGINNDNEAIENYYKAIQSMHIPELKAINMVQTSPYLAPAQKSFIKQLEPTLMSIFGEARAEEQKAIKDIRNAPYNQNALIVQNERTSLFAKIKEKILSIFKQEKVEENNKKEYQQNPKPDKTWRDSQRVEVKQPSSLEKTDETEYIAVSDLHGNMDKWKQVKKVLLEKPNVKIIMLGDAMDRGNWGPEILLQIKEWCDSGRMEYLPGNHDVFAYQYMDTEHPRIRREGQIDLEHNGGEVTMSKLDHLDAIVDKEITNGHITHPITKEEFRTWLGNLAIQKKLEVNGNKYALSHAIFDEKLYEADSNFNLAKAMQLELTGKSDSELYRRFDNCMWYREGMQDEYGDEPLPLAIPEGYILVAGHTRQFDVNWRHVEGNPKAAMFYIDTGKGDFKGLNLNKREEYEFSNKKDKER